MSLKSLICEDRTFDKVAGNNKKTVFETVANLIATVHPELKASEILDGFNARERLGSTAIGEGVAIPHCRTPHSSKELGFLVRLEKPIDFDAPDQKSIDLLFFLIVPTESRQQHLQLLSELAEVFSQAKVRQQLRSATSAEILYSSLYNAVA